MKYLYILILTFAISFHSNAQILWQISGNNLKEPSYILGTHHYCDGMMTDSIPGYKFAFENVKQVYGEVSFKDLTSPNADDINLMRSYMTMPAGEKLSDLYSPRKIKTLNKQLSSVLGTTIERLDALKPMTVATNIQNTILSQSVNTPQIPIDLFVITSAHKCGKESYGLETLKFQLETLYGTSLKEQANDLIKLLNDKHIVEKTQSLSDAYKDQDLQRMWKFFKGDLSKKEYDRVVKKRNFNWMPEIESAINTQSTLFVVGAGHLPGKYGLVNMLRNSGYIVEPVLE